MELRSLASLSYSKTCIDLLQVPRYAITRELNGKCFILRKPNINGRLQKFCINLLLNKSLFHQLRHDSYPILAGAKLLPTRQIKEDAHRRPSAMRGTFQVDTSVRTGSSTRCAAPGREHTALPPAALKASPHTDTHTYQHCI